MNVGTIPELINSVAVLIVTVFVVNVLVKLGRLIDRFRESSKKE
jgi:uncharacterized protein YoxC